MATASGSARSAKVEAQKTGKVLWSQYKVFPDFQGEVVLCKILCPSLDIRAEPSPSSKVFEKKCQGEMIVIRNDNLAPDPELGWMEVLYLSQRGFVPTSARGTELEPLPYASIEFLQFFRYGLGHTISQVEDLILSRIQKVSVDSRSKGQVLQIGSMDFEKGFKELYGEGTESSYAVAVNIRSNLYLALDAASRYVRTCRPFRKGELLEACRIFSLLDKPGEALMSAAVELDDGSFGMPLGYAAYYTRAERAADANAEASLAEWAVGGGYVLLIHANKTIYNGQVPVLFGKPKRLDSPWTLDGPQKPKGMIAAQMEVPMGVESSGLVRWGASKLHGAGVFAMEPRVKGSVLELCPAMPLDSQSASAAKDYCMSFERFGTLEPEACCLNLGLGSLYNHNDHSNADYWYDRSMGTVAIVALEDIPAGAEIFINYGEGYWKSRMDFKK